MRLVLVQQRLGGSSSAGGEMSQLSNVPLAIGGFDANEVAKTAMTVPVMTTLLLLLLLLLLPPLLRLTHSLAAAAPPKRHVE